MKIIKTANGKKIIITKKEWFNIGKKYQWLKNVIAQAAAPVKAPTQTPTQTPTKTPDKTPSRTPFNPPRPKVTPGPKAKKEEVDFEKFDETEDIASSTLKSFSNFLKFSQHYEDESHPSLREFWSNIPEQHIYKDHPVLSKHGQALSEEGFGFSRDILTKEGKNPRVNMTQMVMEARAIIQQINSLESQHKDELVEMAKDITCDIWGIDRSMLKGELRDDSGEMGMQEDEPEERNIVPLTPRLKKEVDKRVTSNIMTQGAAVHAMASVHHLVAERINEISPELLKLYTHLSGLTTHHYYAINIPAMIAMIQKLSQASIGWSKVEYPEAEAAEGDEEAPPPQPVVNAKGMCFPVLVQEMFKGVMELLSMHGISQDLNEDELHTIYHHADRLEHEPWQITVGPALWRKFISVLPENAPLSEIVMKFNMKSPDEIHNIINSIIEEPEVAKNIMTGIVEETDEVEGEEEVYQDPIPDVDDFGNLGVTPDGEMVQIEKESIVPTEETDAVKTPQKQEKLTLDQKMQKAIEKEDYEEASKIRDQIEELKKILED